VNVIILTGKFGMGHIKCAQAIEELIQTRNTNVKVEVIDFLEYCFPEVNGLIYRSFESVVNRMTGAYNLLTKAANKKDTVFLKKTMVHRIGKLMDLYKPDLVIACLPLCSVYFSEYKREKNSELPFYVYITDIFVHSDWLSEQVDAYFVGAQETKNNLIDRGIEEDRIHVTGIPVMNSFTHPQENGNNEKAMILIMGGGLGLIPGGERTLSILNETDDITATVICGKNDKLRTLINERYKRINAIGYIEDTSPFMLKADVLLTKPGGITTFEAINSQTPLYIIEPQLLQESGNVRFIEERELGIVVESLDNFSIEALLRLLRDNLLLSNIRNNMKNLISQFEDVNPLSIYGEVS